MKRLWKWIGIILCILIGVSGLYISDYSQNTDESALQNTNDVKVTKTDFGYFFDGPSEEEAMIFYPGGKVEDLAYSRLLKEIASNGIDCFLVHMPANLAVLSPNKAQDVLNEYSYDSWYIGGHSLGGSMAASFASKHANTFSGLILLAAYSTKDLSDTNLKVLTIYGSNDKVLNKDRLKQYEEYLPKDNEVYVIQGGNHSGFGTYGKQDGDGKRSISHWKQIEVTASKIQEIK